MFEDTADYYKDSCALFGLTFDGKSDAEVSRAAYE